MVIQTLTTPQHWAALLLDSEWEIHDCLDEGMLAWMTDQGRISEYARLLPPVDHGPYHFSMPMG